MSAAGRSRSMAERVEEALVLAAYLVVRHGPEYAPFVERLEKELELARESDPVERARRILDRFTVNGGWKSRWGDGGGS